MGPVADPVVRPERTEDHAAVAAVVEQAFRSAAEARLVEAIRDSPGYLPDLSLVAERGGRVVGHVMISLVGIEAGDGSTGSVPSLSPLAVHPGEQGHGIGSVLVQEVTAAARRRGEALVVLEGDPRYYGRFGFEPAADHGIRIDLPSWAPPEAAQVLVLRRDRPLPAGRVAYPPAFDLVIEH
jgi:putative acetyltransferase